LIVSGAIFFTPSPDCCLLLLLLLLLPRAQLPPRRARARLAWISI